MLRLLNAKFIVIIGLLLSTALTQSCGDDEPLLPGTIDGIVTNAQFDNEPIAGATVSISGINEQKVTGSDGRFEFIVESNNDGYTLQYTHPEFRSDEKSNVKVEPSGQTSADIALTPIVPLELSALDLDFGSSSSQESFNITNLRNGELDFSVTTSATFLTATPNSGRLGAQNTSVIRVNLDRADLAVGSYSEQVIINVPNRGSAVVNVQITVLDASAAILSLDQTTLGYGTETTSRTLKISNTGEKILEWTASVSESWISLSDVSGSLNPTEDQTISVIVNRTGLDAGQYTGRVDFGGNGGTPAVSISMEVVAGNAQAILGVSETEFDFGLEVNSFDVSINNTGNADLEWTATSSDSWLSLSRTSGSVTPTGSQSVTLNVDRSGLAEGTLTGTVSVTSNGGDVTLNATMQVPSQNPVLSLSTTTLDFGDTDDLRTLTIENTGLQDLNWSATTDQQWLTLSSTSGRVSPSSSQDINVNIERGALADGTYSAQISFTSDGGDQVVSVNMQVVGNGAGQDADSDGIPDAVDADDDNDGLIDVYTIDDLNDIRNDLRALGTTLQGGPVTGFIGYELMNNLDFDDESNYEDVSLKPGFTTGSGWNPIGTSSSSSALSTILEGNGFVIKNLLMDKVSDYTSLIASTSILAEVRNLQVQIKFVSGDQYTSGLVAYNRGKIFNCSVLGSINSGADSGLLVGSHGQGTIENCFAEGTITSSSSNIGGLIGSYAQVSSTLAEVKFSYAKVSVSGSGCLGGLAGCRVRGIAEFSSCYATGEVNGNGRDIGGLLGGGSVTVSNSYATGSATTEQGEIGGFIGTAGTVTNSYSTGKAIGTFSVGGFAGVAGSITSTNYWDVDTSGLTGSAGSPTGLSTIELQGQTTNSGIYATWDPDIWDFGTSGQYPALKNMPGGLNAQRN